MAREEKMGEVVRIFVGGLDVGVTASDVQKRFSLSPSLGKVLAVELITKNNDSNNHHHQLEHGVLGDGGGIPISHASNFAYIDFQPSSPKSLLKLFSTYNGCVWKGGRLRLEKAKEHYMARLKREWEEEARLANDAGKGDADLGENTQGSLKQLGRPRPAPAEQEKMQLQIFFPKLRKVKSLPYRGTGKHKYSFQRVEVPSLPVHFCDCDEHCTPVETASEEPLPMSRTHFDGINAEELDIMNSVMSKIFQREAIVDSADTAATSADAGNYSRCTVDDVPSNEIVAAEEDNLLTNIVMESANGRAGSMQLDGVETPMDKVLKDLKKSPPSKGRPQKKQTTALKSKKTAPADAPDVKLKKKARLADESVRDESSVKIDKRSSEVNSGQMESSSEAQLSEAQMKSDANLSARGVGWVQKSSWKELVGETGNSTFSIGNVVPGITSMKQTLPKSDFTNTINGRGPKPNNRATAQFNVDSSKLLADENHGEWKDKLISAHDPNVETSEKEGKGQLGLMGEKSSTVKDKILRLPEEPKKKVDVDGRARLAATGIGEVCTFMRSADSEREWTKARAALSGILQKKNKGNTSKNF